MNVTVFGGSKPRTGDPEYAEAYLLGRLLAQAGHTVLTGGYGGTMQAVSQGANEAGGHVVGITCGEIERWSGSLANQWVQEEEKPATLHDRMVLLMDRADAVLALPGGVGTLAEISLFWNRMIVQSIPRRNFILIGQSWQVLFNCLYDTLGEYFPEEYRQMCHFSPGVNEAVSKLAEMVI